jgi:hypothetical protein
MKAWRVRTGFALSCGVALTFGITIERLLHRVEKNDASQPLRKAPLSVHNGSEETQTPPLAENTVETRSFDEVATLAFERDKAGDPIGFGRLILAWIRSAHPAELKTVLEQERDAGNLHSTEPLTWGLAKGTLDLVLMRWAEVDRTGAVAWALMRDAVPDEERIMSDLAKGHAPWLKTAPEEALTSIASATTNAREPSLKQARKFIAARHANLDFDWAVGFGVEPGVFAQMWRQRGAAAVTIAAAAIGAQRLSKKDKESVLRTLAGDWIQRGNELLKDVRALLGMIDDPTWHDAIKDSAAKALAYSNRDPLGALRLADEFNIPFSNFSPGPARGGQLMTAFDHDPEGTIAFLAEMKNPENREILLSNIFSPNGHNYALQARLDLYLQLSPEERPAVSRLEGIVSRAGSSPRATHQWLVDVLNSEQSKSDADVLNRFASSNTTYLALQSSEAAVAAIEELPEGEFREAMVKGAITGMMGHDLETALRLVEGLNGDDRTEIEATVMRHFINAEGAEAGTAMLRDVPDTKLRRELAMNLTLSIGLPAADAVQIFETFLGNDDQAIASASILVNEWAQVDPEAASDWVTAHTVVEHHAARVKHLLSDWITLDLTAATEFVKALDPGPAYDAGASKIIALALEGDPHSALQWSATLNDSKARRVKLREAALAIERFATRPGEAHSAILQLQLDKGEEVELFEQLKN